MQRAGKVQAQQAKECGKASTKQQKCHEQVVFKVVRKGSRAAQLQQHVICCGLRDRELGNGCGKGLKSGVCLTGGIGVLAGGVQRPFYFAQALKQGKVCLVAGLGKRHKSPVGLGARNAHFARHAHKVEKTGRKKQGHNGEAQCKICAYAHAGDALCGIRHL